MIKGTVIVPITFSCMYIKPTTVYIIVRSANKRLALLGLFQVIIIEKMIINPGKRAPKNSKKPKPGLRSNNKSKKNKPTIRARILGV